MAAIIDGVTHSGYWKITPDDSLPTKAMVIPKGSIYADNVNDAIYFLTDRTNSICAIQDIKDHLGNTLTVTELFDYLENYR